jgi:hypothetical protein
MVERSLPLYDGGEAMTPYSDAELRYARPVAEAILADKYFRGWLLAGTPHQETYSNAEPLGDIQAALRSKGMKNPYWFNYWCGKDSRCTCRIGTGIETDVLVVLDSFKERRLAIHIEIKRPGDTLGSGQAESYPRRAACWADPATKPGTVPAHEDFVTILICGKDLESDTRVSAFDKVIFHDAIAERLTIYPERPKAVMPLNTSAQPSHIPKVSIGADTASSAVRQSQTGYQILSGVKKPPAKRQRYNFNDMLVGDMMFVPLEGDDEISELRSRVSGAASMFGKRWGMQFSTQETTIDGRFGVGIWRTS